LICSECGSWIRSILELCHDFIINLKRIHIEVFRHLLAERTFEVKDPSSIETLQARLTYGSSTAWGKHRLLISLVIVLPADEAFGRTDR
jgi:hypothetical protein